MCHRMILLCLSPPNRQVEGCYESEAKAFKKAVEILVSLVPLECMSRFIFRPILSRTGSLYFLSQN